MGNVYDKRKQSSESFENPAYLSGFGQRDAGNQARAELLAPEGSNANPDLGSIMAARAQSLNPTSGVRRELPSELQGRLESHFGYSVSNLSFRESSDVNAIGAKAYASGNEIHFKPGEFRPDTPLGQKMIGHEVSHILQQAHGGAGAAGSVSLDTGLESSADRDGDAIASMSGMSGYAPTANLSAMPTAAVSAAPVQGWGVGGKSSWLFALLGGKTGKKGFANKVEGGHEMLTRKASEKAQTALGDSAASKALKQNAESLKAGARFNDVYHSHNIPFVAKYLSHSDEFINQTHHGDMQFLHSMDTSGGDLQKNAAKIQRWGEFASDTYQNEVISGEGEPEKRFQDQNMLDYVMGSDDTMQEMMLSTMVGKKALVDIEKRAEVEARESSAYQAAYKEARQNGIKAHLQQMQAKKQELAAGGLSKKERKAREKDLKKGLSKYADTDIKGFFTGGDKKLDAGHVALGSASHMLEDSFAGSHAIRATNIKDQHQIGGLQVGAGQGGAIAAQTTPIMINADYTAQDSGKHGKADFLRSGSLTEEGRRSGFDEDDANIAATRGAGLARDVAAQFMYEVAAGHDPSEFLQSVTQVDTGAQGGTTASGRQYGKTVKDKAAKKEIKAYQKSMEKTIAPNIEYSAGERARIYANQLGQLDSILSKAKSAEAKTEYRKHVQEILIDSEGMKAQLSPGQDTDAAAELDSVIALARGILEMHQE